jgi:hypothetical protein
MSLKENFIAALRSVAADIDAGTTFKPRAVAEPDGCPRCAVGQVAARCGVAPDDHVEGVDEEGMAFTDLAAYQLFTLFGVEAETVFNANDSKRWSDCARALREAADTVEAGS